ncbi:MAG: hypothetical protein V7700_12160 [Halioglobus sp.]
MAKTDSGEDHWVIGGSAYLWAAGVDGTSAEGDDLDISFTDIAKDLDGGVMGVVAAQHGKWTLIADIIYLTIQQDTNTTANLIGLPQKIDTNVKLKGFISTFGAAYRVVEGEKSQLDLLAGARYGYMDVDFDAVIDSEKTTYADSDYSLDGILGFQALINLNHSWYLSFYADIGAGDSELTWQVWPGVGYRVGDLDAVAGYRRLEWETDNGDTFEDLGFSGPMLGVKFRF